MKDLEKIKSEDLGCQVQDANPGNFAIEQEVAQLVGATVPAPTEPDDDDARELGAQLLVFLRRALLPIRSALRTALAAIYAHLDSRCTDYTPAAYDPFMLPAGPYDPMRPFVPRTLPNLLTAITAFASRKISNGSATNDGIPDGVSLAHLFCETSIKDSVVELKDDNSGWVLTKSLDCHTPVFPNLEKITIGAVENTTHIFYVYGYNAEMPTLKEIHLPNLVIGRNLIEPNAGTSSSFHPGFANLETITFPALREIKTISGEASHRQAFISRTIPSVTKLEMPELVTLNNYLFGGAALAGLTELRMPKLKYANYAFFNTYITPTGYNCPNLQLFEVGPVETNLNISFWNPTDKGTTFLQNFKEHIALRLTDQGSGLTLTLSQAVFDTIWNQDGTPKSTDPDSVIYQINKIIKTDKHWSVNRA